MSQNQDQTWSASASASHLRRLRLHRLRLCLHRLRRLRLCLRRLCPCLRRLRLCLHRLHRLHRLHLRLLLYYFVSVNCRAVKPNQRLSAGSTELQV